MKKIFFVSMLLISADAEAQHYRKFLFAIDVGMPSNEFAPIGLFALEPAYRLSDKIEVGFRMEHIGFLSMTGSNKASLGSMGINGHYYFNITSLRPFCGLGLGLYNPSDNFIMNSTDIQYLRNRFGVYPRIGLEFRHMRLMVEYNFIQKLNDYIPPDINAMMMTGAQGHYEMVNQSYLSLKIGFFIGGGKKKIN